MKRLIMFALASSILFSCAGKKADVKYLNNEKANASDVEVSPKAKKEIKKIVKSEVELPATKAEKIEKVVKQEKAEIKKKMEKKVAKIITPYKEEKIKKTTMLLKSPITPIKEPDTILRIMLMPYVDEKQAFHSGEYLFVKVEEGKWILGQYVKKDKRVVKEYNPLVEVKE